MADEVGQLGPILGTLEGGVVEWKPKLELITPLLEMGLSENSAKRVKFTLVIFLLRAVYAHLLN